jgi:magnesium-dependent phosphatase 1
MRMPMNNMRSTTPLANKMNMMLAVASLLVFIPFIFGFQGVVETKTMPRRQGFSSRSSFTAHAAAAAKSSTTTSTTQLYSSSSSSSSSSSPSPLHPKLIVLDLDHTLWTPELYTLRNLERAKVRPIARKDVNLFPGAQQVMEQIRQGKFPHTRFAVASRTKSVAWAHDLLEQFGIRDLFDHVEIFPGDKQSHFLKLQQASGVGYQEMLFFDDARDGKYGNCERVSQMGVLSVHCKNGLDTMQIFQTALERYAEWDKSPNTIVETDGTVTDGTATRTVTTDKDTIKNANARRPVAGERQTGTVKMFNVEKGFGFIQYGDSKTKDVFFHVNDLPDGTGIVETGQELTFHVARDARNDKTMAKEIQSATSTSSQDTTVPIHVFSMNLPFAALLANGYKDLESRNGTMFVPYPAGTQMLLHVGRRLYPDGNKHLQVMKSGGLEDTEIEALKSLPPGFKQCGMAVAICELGDTYETTVEERSDPAFQRRVAAFGADSGRMVTEIRKVAYLKQPVKVTGQGGVFTTRICPDVIPDGWVLVASSASPPSTKGKKNLPKNKYSNPKTSSTKEEPSSSSETTQPVYSISG